MNTSSEQEIYDEEGNVVGYRITYPSGATRVVYPKRLQDNIRAKKDHKWRARAMGYHD